MSVDDNPLPPCDHDQASSAPLHDAPLHDARLHDDHTLSDLDVASQCLLYLSGELAPHHAQAFEQQLQSSTEIAQELARQSKRLCLLSGCDVPTPDTVDQAGVELAKPELAKPELASRMLWRYASFAVALTAALLVVLSLRNTRQVQDVTIDDAEIAAAWAATDSTWPELAIVRDETESVSAEATSAESLTVTDSSDFVGPFGEETVPSWMLAALDTSTELLDPATNDHWQHNRPAELNRPADFNRPAENARL